MGRSCRQQHFRLVRVCVATGWTWCARFRRGASKRAPSAWGLARQVASTSRQRLSVGFVEFRSRSFSELRENGLETFDLEYDVQAFNERLPRVRIIPIEEFDPTQFL